MLGSETATDGAKPCHCLYKPLPIRLLKRYNRAAYTGDSRPRRNLLFLHGRPGYSV